VLEFAVNLMVGKGVELLAGFHTLVQLPQGEYSSSVLGLKKNHFTPASYLSLKSTTKLVE
jgi:hypothetical protein